MKPIRSPEANRESVRRLVGLFVAFVVGLSALAARAADVAPVILGIDAEFGLAGSTSAHAISLGARIAADEINAAGGVLGGRPIQIVERDNRSVPARSIKNLQELAADPRVVAVMSGKYSPAVVEALPEVHRLRLPLLVSWAVADRITHHGFTPDYVFRLSLTDDWAMGAMVRHAQGRGSRRIGLLVPNGEWGRSGHEAIERHRKRDGGFALVETRWYNWGDTSFKEHYEAIRGAGADVLILVANDREGALLVREVAALPPEQRLPIIAHVGITGGAFVAAAGAALRQVDLAVVQTYSFIGAKTPAARRVVEAAKRIGVPDARKIESPIGVAHAYDLVHILARAIKLAGTTDRAAIRDSLEKVSDYPGLVKHYARAFEPGRHDALSAREIFLARFADDGAIERLPQPGK